MRLDDRFNELREAVKALGVADLAEDESAGEDRLRRLHLAVAVTGTAEAHAMVQASAIANDDGALVDPMETLDPGAYRATGMRGNGTVSSDGLWSIWTMRRLQAHITSLAHTNPQDDLVTASTLLDGVHAPAVRTCLLGTRSGSGTRRMPSHSVPAHRECSDDDAGC
jgi:hypothetical protein